MIKRACRSYCCISAVMIGEDQSFVTDNFTGAASPKNDNCIFDGSLIDAVQLFFGKFQSFFNHIIINLFPKQKGKPHSFICKCLQDEYRQYNRYKKFLHAKRFWRTD